jgi:hypothetical protein
MYNDTLIGSRRPAVNPRPVGHSGTDPESLERKLARSCKRCGRIGLVYVEVFNETPIHNLMCIECGWQPFPPVPDPNATKKEEGDEEEGGKKGEEEYNK